MSGAEPQRAYHEDLGYYEERAGGLLASARWCAPCSGGIVRRPACWPSTASSPSTFASPRAWDARTWSSPSFPRAVPRLPPREPAARSTGRRGGFPAWHPSDDPAEILDEALAWAARSDRVACLDVLAARGAGLDADVYRGTPLAWATSAGRYPARIRSTSRRLPWTVRRALACDTRTPWVWKA
jgi:hypothetical protein